MMPITRRRAKKVGRVLRFQCSFVIFLAAACAASTAAAQRADTFELSLPSNARETYHDTVAPASYAYASANQSGDLVPLLRAEGRVSRTAWRVRSEGLETLQLMAPLAEQLEAEGFTALHRCVAQECGGYDFRFALDVIAPPDMFVDLFDYRYAAFARPIAPQSRNDPAAAADAPPPSEGQGDPAQPAAAAAPLPAAPVEQTELVVLLVSRAGASGYVQMVHIAPVGSKAAESAAARASVALDAPAATPLRAQGESAPVAADMPLPEALRHAGHVILDDLNFETGSATLGDGPFASLAALAGMLLSDATLKVALVGHTDTVGSLEGNIALSKRRAGAVVERLVSAYGVPRGQLEGEGMGYLSPRTANLTAKGREANRRVEVVLLNTE